MITACPACGLIIDADENDAGVKIVCPRCSSVIFHKNSMSYAFALAVSALALMVPAFLFPFLRIQVGDSIMEATIVQCVQALDRDGYTLAGAAVFYTAFLCPVIYLSLICYASLDTMVRRCLPFACLAAHAVRLTADWHMVDVFLVGILVSVVKLVDMADVSFGIGFYLLSAVCVLMIISGIYYESRSFWLKRRNCH